jgi:type II secretion system protein L
MRNEWMGQMPILRLYLSEQGLAAGACWALRDARGRVLDSGDQNDPWPKARTTELVVAAGNTLFTELALPAGISARHADVLGYALEARLVNQPEDNLFLGGKIENSGMHWVALTARAPLEQAVALLLSQERKVGKIMPEEMLLPAPDPDCWSLARLGHGWMVRQSRYQAVFLSCRAEALAVSLGALPAQGITVCGASRLPESWESVSRTEAGAYDWRRAAGDSLVDFSRAIVSVRSHWPSWRASLRRSAQLLLCVALLDTGLNLLASGVLSWRQSALERAMVAMAREVGQGATSAQPALQQTGVLLERLRRLHGVPVRTGALELMAALGQVAGPDFVLRSLKFDQNRLYFQMDSPAPPVLEQWRQALAVRRLDLALDADGGWVLGAKGPGQ